jgi:hypothetical protein
MRCAGETRAVLLRAQELSRGSGKPDIDRSDIRFAIDEEQDATASHAVNFKVWLPDVFAIVVNCDDTVGQRVVCK